MATYQLTFAQLNAAIAQNSFDCLSLINNWYDSFADALKAKRPDTYIDWSRCGKVNRETHLEFINLAIELNYFLDYRHYEDLQTATVTLTHEQIALLRSL